MASPLTATLTMFSIQVGFPVAGILVANKMFYAQRHRKFRYGVAITSFAFGGWYLSNYFTTKYLENVEITLNSEFSEPYYGKGGLDFGRDSKGRFRRQLVTPIQDKEYEYGMLTKEKTNSSPPKQTVPVASINPPKVKMIEGVKVISDSESFFNSISLALQMMKAQGTPLPSELSYVNRKFLQDGKSL